MSRLPFIGITGYHVTAEEGFGGKLRGLPGQGFCVIAHDYIDAASRAGAVPVGIPVSDMEQVGEIASSFDGFIFSGGEDIDPALYGERPDMRFWTLSPERDRFELELLRAALTLNKPVVAICRGMQLVNVYFGGTLYKDISDIPGNPLSHQFNRAPRWYLAHKVKLIHPFLQTMFAADELMTNSYHHQVVKDVGKGLVAGAVAEDGVVEGLVHPDYPNLVAIQWHPETLSVKYEVGMTVFHWLIKQAQKKEGKKS